MIGSAMQRFRLLPMYSIKLMQYKIHLKDALFHLFTLCYPTKKKQIIVASSLLLKIDSPKRVTIDFEVAVRNSIIATHQSAPFQFFSHMIQSVWRHVQSPGNTHNYQKNHNFRELSRMLLATAFLPVEDIPTA